MSLAAAIQVMWLFQIAAWGSQGGGGTDARPRLKCDWRSKSVWVHKHVAQIPGSSNAIWPLSTGWGGDPLAAYLSAALWKRFLLRQRVDPTDLTKCLETISTKTDLSGGRLQKRCLRCSDHPAPLSFLLSPGNLTRSTSLWDDSSLNSHSAHFTCLHDGLLLHAISIFHRLREEALAPYTPLCLLMFYM